MLVTGLAVPAKSQIEDTALLLQQTPDEGGVVQPTQGVHHFQKDSTVTLKAVPNPGYQFVYWLGDVADATTSTTTVYLDTPKIVIAVFERTTFDFVAMIDRPQNSIGRSGSFPSAADYVRTGASAIGRKRYDFDFPPPPEPPEFPVPEGDLGPDFPVPEGDLEPDFPVPIPEPATIGLLGGGALIATARSKRRTIEKRTADR